MSQFSNKGHIYASIGAAVGIANLVLFPARVQNYGGFAFIIVFILTTLILGVPLMIAETSIGKNSQVDAVNAYEKIGGKYWKYAGVFGIITCIFILSFYIVVAGWALYYFYLYLFDYSTLLSDSPGTLFGSFISNESLVILFSFFALVFGGWVVGRNINKGIEWVSKQFVPLLVVLVIFLIISIPFVATTPLNYSNFTMDFSKLFSLSSGGRIGIIEAFGQAFFSLSLGACGMITYGTHVRKETNLVKNSRLIVHTDTIVALLGALLVIPLFSTSESLSASPALVFINLVDTFNSYGPVFGRIIGGLFFFLFNVAILTSVISLMEPSVNHLVKSYGLKRIQGTLVVVGLVGVLSLPAIYSIDPSNSTILTNFFGYGDGSTGSESMGYFNFVLDFFGTFCLLIGGLLVSQVIRSKWTFQKFFEEIQTQNYQPSESLQRWLKISIKFITPVLMILLIIGEGIKLYHRIW